MRIFRPRNIAVVVIVLFIAAITYAFAAANTVPESGAGDGSGTISGYTITNVTYDTMNGDTDPSTLDTVTFDIAPTGSASAPTEVSVKLVSSSTTWFSCTNTSGTTWSCTITGVNTLAADELRVVAAQ